MRLARWQKWLWLPIVALCAIALAPVTPAHAWGDAGHRIVCQLAYLELSPDVKAKVDQIIAQDPKYHSFAASCTWADAFPPVRPAEHFLNVPRTAQAVDAAHLCPTSAICVASAILDDARDLSLAQEPGEKLRLLKSLGHWVGDIHQPLHVSFEDDKGGSLIDASGLCGQNLHLAWDVCIMEAKIGGDEIAIAEVFRKEITPEDRKNWTPERLDAAAVAAWATESLIIAKSPAVHYCYEHGSACWYTPDSSQFTGQKRDFAVSQGYLDDAAPIVKARLKRAGLRLAAILNSTLK